MTAKNTKKKKLNAGYDNIIWGVIISIVSMFVIGILLMGPGEILNGAKGFNWKNTDCKVANFAEKSKHDDDLSGIIHYTYEFKDKTYSGSYKIVADDDRHLERLRDIYSPGVKKNMPGESGKTF